MFKQLVIPGPDHRIRRFVILLISYLIVNIGVVAVFAEQPHCPPKPFKPATLSPAFELIGPGKDVDTIDFWEAPDSSKTLMFVTAKGNSLLEVWEYPFLNNGKPPLYHETFTNCKVNGIIIDQETDLMYISISRPTSTVSVFRLPDMSFVMNFNKPGANYGGEPNIALLKLESGEKRIYVSADDIIYIHDAETGRLLDEFEPPKGVETIVADPVHQRIFVPDENDRSGVYVFDPDGKFSRQYKNNPFGTDDFQKDAEGIIIYKCSDENGEDNGSGFIVVSDQKKKITEFEFYDRQTWKHLGFIRIKGVSNTDGIASFQKPLPDYPMGLFVAVNDDMTTVGIGWDVIFKHIQNSPEVDADPEPQIRNP